MLTLGWGIIILAVFIIFSGIIGVFRFPDFYTKIHAASIIECCGVPMCLFGFAFLQTSSVLSFKLLFGALLIFLLSPVATHALVKASLVKNKLVLDQLEQEAENFNITHENSVDHKDV